jgi:hypothetical protein
MGLVNDNVSASDDINQQCMVDYPISSRHPRL